MSANTNVVENVNAVENVNVVPALVKIARDVDIIDNQPVGVVQIIRTEKMTPENFPSLCAFTAQYYESAVSGYGCDVCNAETSVENPIYTNSNYQGCDICQTCLSQAFNSGKLEKLSGWNPGPVYSLERIYQLVKDASKNSGLNNDDNDDNDNDDDNWADMNRREAKEEAFRSDLQKKGHKCVFVMETFPSRTGWCGQEKCTGQTY